MLTPLHIELAARFDRRMALANSGHPYTKCPGCGKFMSPSGACGHCNFVEDDDRLIARGKRAMERASTGKLRTVKDAMYRKGLGTIDFDLGWPPKGEQKVHGSGVLKLLDKHHDDMPAIPETIVKGKVVTAFSRETGKPDPQRIYIIRNPFIATLRKSGEKRWSLTSHYRNGSQAKAFEDRAREFAQSSK